MPIRFASTRVLLAVIVGIFAIVAILLAGRNPIAIMHTLLATIFWAEEATVEYIFTSRIVEIIGLIIGIVFFGLLLLSIVLIVALALVFLVVMIGPRQHHQRQFSEQE